MAQTKATPQIFNHDRRALRRARAVRRFFTGKGEGFLLKQVGVMAAEKLMDVNRRFETGVVIGLPAFKDQFLDQLPLAKHPKKLISYDHWPQTLPEGCDLILSGLVLQSRNDIPALIMAARRALKPDGLFLASIVGGESLLGLRRACFGADQDRFGGAIPRVAPMINLQQAGGLLAVAGLAQPVIDRDVIKTSYRCLHRLADDLRDIGETNCLAAAGQTLAGKRFSGRDFLSRIEAHYADRNETGAMISDFEILWMTGWAPHESQQKPLRPGSAKIPLSEALKKIRD